MPKDTFPYPPYPGDPREHFLLADHKPLMRAIPKQYLGQLACDYGSQDKLAQKLSEGGKSISRTTVNGWIRGTLRMSNKSVIYVSHVLDVSPLCVLDLCWPYETESSTAFAGRIATCELLQCLYDWQTVGERTRATNLYAMAVLADMNLGNPSTPFELSDAIKRIRGDYRDLQRLVVDTATYYAKRCDLARLGGFIGRIIEAGRTYRYPTE